MLAKIWITMSFKTYFILMVTDGTKPNSAYVWRLTANNKFRLRSTYYSPPRLLRSGPNPFSALNRAGSHSQRFGQCVLERQRFSWRGGGRPSLRHFVAATRLQGPVKTGVILCWRGTGGTITQPFDLFGFFEDWITEVFDDGYVCQASELLVCLTSELLVLAIHEQLLLISQCILTITL